MADGRHFENCFIFISQSELGVSDFDQIWYADANFHFRGWLFDKNRNCWLYLHISAVKYPILIKSGKQVQISIPSMEI